MDSMIYDTARRAYDVVVDRPQDSNYLILNVLDGKRSIGSARCHIYPEKIILGDICIRNDITKQGLLFVEWMRRLFRRKPRTINYRGKGIGTQLLQFVVRYAREKGLNHIEGDVGPLDWKHNPNLPNWYRRNGFTVSESGELYFDLTQ